MTEQQAQNVPPVVPPLPPTPGNNPDNPFGSPGVEFDDEFDTDLTGVSSGYTVKAGAYAVFLVDVEKEISSNGNPMWVWTWQIAEGDNAGKQFKNWTALTPQALWKVAETTEALGLGSGKQVKFTRDAVLGTVAIAHLADDEYEGRKSSKIMKLEQHPKGAHKMTVSDGVPS